MQKQKEKTFSALHTAIIFCTLINYLNCAWWQLPLPAIQRVRQLERFKNMLDSLRETGKEPKKPGPPAINRKQDKESELL